MLRKLLSFTTAFIVATGFVAMAQSGEIKGKVLDKTTKEPLPFANVVVELNGSQAGGAQTDFDGNFTIKPLTPGRYDLKASFVGYNPISVTGVLVSADKITFQDLAMGKGAIDITAIDVVSYKNPIIDKGNPSTQTTVTQEEIKVAPTRDVRSVASTTAGVYQEDEGESVNVRGSRDNATDYYIDGIKVRGSTSLPQSGVEQITVVTGGVPAQYGDATGGIINITTRGPSKEFFGGIEYVTSEIFDQYGYNLVGANISGPIWSRKNKEGKVEKTLMGFFLAAEYQSEKDPDPSAIGMYKVKDEVWDDISRNPLSPSLTSGTSFNRKSEFLNASSFEKIKYKQNVPAKSYRFSGKLDVQPFNNLTLTFGGSYDQKADYGYADNFIFTYSLFNSDENPERINSAWRVFGRLTHKLGSSKTDSEASASVLKNTFYSIQADYSKTQRIFQDGEHGDNYFNYGYLGRYDVTKKKGLSYTLEVDTITGDTTFYQQSIPSDSVLSYYTPGGMNALTEAYINQYLQLTGFYDDPAANYVGNFENLTQIVNNGGLRNGDNPRNVYSMWRNSGYQYPQYDMAETSQFRISAQLSTDLKNHAISAGFEYEQRKDRGFRVYTTSIANGGLWGLMRLRANEHNRDLDLDNPIISYVNGNTFYHYDRNYTNEGGIPGFFEFLRERLSSMGYQNVSTTDFINIDNLDPSVFSLDLFSADELLNGGNELISYYGRNYTGEEKTGAVAFEDFWTAKDSRGNFTRPIGAFEPIYMAGYIQDKFAINDLIFNIGVRIDRFDANQKVLRDKYLLYPAKTAGQVAPDRPSNIGSDYIVYVSDVSNPTGAQIVGYRDGDDWYDANGTFISNPQLLADQSGGKIAPWLVDSSLANNGVQTSKFKPSDSFKDYDPDITIMPRISFSFPISDEALFFAHYDVLTQRPPSRTRNNPLDFYYFESQGRTLNNPDLKPEKTIDYEIGFRQALSKSSAFTISAFYRELRNMIQFTKVNYAFPRSYQTFENIDFGTVKGLTLGYDLRRTGNVRLAANYTLQFADGTGSADNSADRLVNNGQPNLRAIAPLDFDQRHAFTVSLDYRYADGKDYNGPMIKNTQIFANTGFNVIFRAGSGTPYSRFREARTEANSLGVQQIGTGSLDGEINGSRKPWQFRVDIKLDRDFKIKFGQSEGSKYITMNLYIQVQNLLNAKNVITVYRYTGNPTDDGYLASSLGQQEAAQQVDPVAFTDQYNIKLNNPDHYSLPRRARIGIKLDF